MKVSKGFAGSLSRSYEGTGMTERPVHLLGKSFVHFFMQTLCYAPGLEVVQAQLQFSERPSVVYLTVRSA
jgi:hypothetical protein